MSRRVVITGIGSLTPIGSTTPDFWNGLVSGKSGTRVIEHFDTADFATKFAAQLENYDPANYFDRKEARKMDLVCQYAMIAASEAMEDCKIDTSSIDKDKVAVIVGTGIGGMNTFYEQSIAFHERGPRGVSPFFYNYVDSGYYSRPNFN